MKNKLISIFLLICLFFVVSCEGESYIESESKSESVNQGPFSVSISVVSENGTASVDKQIANKGEDITVTFDPSEGYFVNKFVVNDESLFLTIADNQSIIEDVNEDLNIIVGFDNVGITYVSLENAPTIDGVIDDVWENAMTFYVSNIHADNMDSSVVQECYLQDAEIKVMWNETGFYFTGRVYAPFVEDPNNRCNFWVSEIYSPEARDYSTNPEDGNYAICVNQFAQNILYTKMDISEYWTASSKVFDDGYIVEIFVPALGKNPLIAGTIMGFDVSVDYYLLGGKQDEIWGWGDYDARDFYTNLFQLGKYWENVGALRPIVLLK